VTTIIRKDKITLPPPYGELDVVSERRLSSVHDPARPVIAVLRAYNLHGNDVLPEMLGKLAGLQLQMRVESRWERR
jgi:hypothetical protein